MMFFTNIRRVIKAGMDNFRRNGFVSLASIVVMVATLFVVTSIMFLSVILNTTLTEIQERVDINVYFAEDAPQEEITTLQNTLESRDDVARVTFTSREEALEQFRTRRENDQLTLQALEEIEGNPLRSQLNVVATDPSEYGAIAAFLDDQDPTLEDGDSLIDSVNYNQNKQAIENLTQVINAANMLGLVLALSLFAISILITFNTIRLAIYTSREEISVMRLVGASYFYIRGPFVITGIIYGVVSALVTLLIIYPLTYWLGPVTEQFFIGVNVYEYYLGNFFTVFLPVVLVAGMILGAVSSFLAVRKYLKL